MGDLVTVPREEWERLLAEVKELKETINELVTTLKPFLYIMERLPHLMTDMDLFKTVAPLLAIPYAMGRVNANVMGGALVGGLECTSKALERLQSMDPAPEFSISKLLFDKETKRALGLLMELTKYLVPCIHEQLRQYRP